MSFDKVQTNVSSRAYCCHFDTLNVNDTLYPDRDLKFVFLVFQSFTPSLPSTELVVCLHSSTLLARSLSSHIIVLVGYLHKLKRFGSNSEDTRPKYSLIHSHKHCRDVIKTPNAIKYFACKISLLLIHSFSHFYMHAAIWIGWHILRCLYTMGLYIGLCLCASLE